MRHHHSSLSVEDRLIEDYEKERSLLMKEIEDMEDKLRQCDRDADQV